MPDAYLMNDDDLARATCKPMLVRDLVHQETVAVDLALAECPKLAKELTAHLGRERGIVEMT